MLCKLVERCIVYLIAGISVPALILFVSEGYPRGCLGISPGSNTSLSWIGHTFSWTIPSKQKTLPDFTQCRDSIADGGQHWGNIGLMCGIYWIHCQPLSSHPLNTASNQTVPYIKFRLMMQGDCFVSAKIRLFIKYTLIHVGLTS